MISGWATDQKDSNVVAFLAHGIDHAPLEVFADFGAPSLSQRHALLRNRGLAFQQLLSSRRNNFCPVGV